MFTLQQSCFQTTETAVSITPNQFPPNHTILQYLFLNATPQYFMFHSLRKFKAIHQVGHDILRCDIPVMPLQYTVRVKMWPINTQLHCSHYKWQLHVSATQQPSSGCLCRKYNRKCYTCSLHIVKNDQWRKISQPYIQRYTVVTG